MNTSPWYTPIPVGTVTAEQRALINREITQRMIANRALVQPGQRQSNSNRAFSIRVFSEFGMARPLEEKFEQGARVLGLPE
jgi:hypothetical protein